MSDINLPLYKYEVFALVCLERCTSIKSFNFCDLKERECACSDETEHAQRLDCTCAVFLCFEGGMENRLQCSNDNCSMFSPFFHEFLKTTVLFYHK